jgi:hypothetical protein
VDPWIVRIVVHAVDDRQIDSLSGGAEQDLAGSCLEVLRGRVLGPEKPGALEHEPDPELGPWQGGGIALREDGYAPAARDQLIAFGTDLSRQHSVHGVVLEKMCQRLRARDVVDRSELEAAGVPELKHASMNASANAAIPVDGNLDCHVSLLSRVTAQVILKVAIYVSIARGILSLG